MATTKKIVEISSGLATALMRKLDGYTITKENFPEPWKSLKEFPASRMIPATGVYGDKDGSFMLRGTTVKALNEMRSGKHFVAVNESNIILEYHSSRDDNVEIATYDYMSNQITLTQTSATAGEDTSYSAINISVGHEDTSYTSGVSLYMVLMFGLLMRHDASGSPEYIEPLLVHWAKAIASTADDVRNRPEVRESYGRVSSSMNKIYSPSSLPAMGIGRELAGIAASSIVDKVTELEMADLREGAVEIKKHDKADVPLISEILNACEFLSAKDSTYFKALDTDEAAEPEKKASAAGSAATYNKMDYEKRIAALREALQLDIHPLSEKEKAMVPVLGKNYVVDQTLLDVAKTIKADWKFPGLGLAPNYILEGDSGSGKTEAAKFFASVHGLPYTKMTMNPTFESANLVGAFYPMYSDDLDGWSVSPTDKRVLERLKEAMVENKLRIMGRKTGSPSSGDMVSDLRAAFSSEEVRDFICDAYKIPDFESCYSDPDAAWKAIGRKGPTPEVEDVIAECETLADNKLWRLYGILCEQAQAGNVSYKFVLSEIMKAFQNGWCLEIQEAASILRPGVLTELNSLLEPNGRLELANGQYVTRHPDTVVIFTTNREYAGNVDLNESLRDRCLLGVKMDLPSVEVMAERAVAQTGCKPDLARSAAKVVRAVCDEAKIKNIKGSYGPRSLYGWILDLMRGDTSEGSFRRRVIEKMTTNEDDIAALMTVYRANSDFASAVRKGKERKY